MTEFINPMPANFQLSPAHIDVWLVDTVMPEHQITKFHSILSSSERDRIDRLRIPAKRLEAIIAHGLLRQILARILQTGPSEIPLTTTAQGKPCLPEHHERQKIHFNLSHTAGKILLAATLDRNLGVDIERIRPHMPHEELARRFFSPTEHAAIAAVRPADRPRAFFTTWCRKEAILKSTGQGISAGLQTFTVPITALPHPFTVERRDDNAIARWTLHDLTLPDPYLASIAIDACNATLRTWQAPPS